MSERRHTAENVGLNTRKFAGAEKLSWQSAEEHLRLGFETPEFRHAFNTWNWGYWMVLLLVLLGVNIVSSFIFAGCEHGFTPSELYQLCANSVAIIIGLVMLLLVPLRGHTVLVSLVAFLFISYYVQLGFSAPPECHNDSSQQLKCVATFVLFSEPPLFLTIFVFTTCRLRPLVPVIIISTCCLISFLSSVGNSIFHIFTSSFSEVSERNMETAMSSIFCGIACMFGAQAGASVFRRQRDIFEYLNDHLSIKVAPRHGSHLQFVCEFADIGQDTHMFFQQYINRLVVTRFPSSEIRPFVNYEHDDEEARFSHWRLTNARMWLRRRAHYLITGIVGLLFPYLWTSWDKYTRSKETLESVIIQSIAMALALGSAIALKALRRNHRGVWATLAFVLSQLFFSASFLYCAGLNYHVWLHREPKRLQPFEPFMFLIFTAHILWNFGVRPLLVFDSIVLVICIGIFALLWHADSSESTDIPEIVITIAGYLLATMATCLCLSLTLEKYDRILWKLHSFVNDDGDMDGFDISWVNPQPFFTGFSPDRTRPSLSFEKPSHPSVNITGFAAQYSDEVFFFIECHLVDQTRQVALRSVGALRNTFLRLLENGDVDHVPYFERSFDNLADASEARIWHAAKRLECILRRHLINDTIALQVLDLESTNHALIPRMNILLLTMGSQGDVVPFISLAKALMAKGHRCRLAAHDKFQSLILAAGIDFFPLASSNCRGHWQVEQIMERMQVIEHSMGSESLFLRPQDLTKMMSTDSAMLQIIEQMLWPLQQQTSGLEPTIGPWAAAIQPDPRTRAPFVAQAIIANPSALVHVHIAEKLGIPCHLAFSQPWTPTRTPGHPLSGSTLAQGDWELKEGRKVWNSALPNPFWDKTIGTSFRWVDDVQWPNGLLGKCMNDFRRLIGLSMLRSVQNSPSLVDELRVPFLYLFSEAVLEKPFDWGPHIDVCGFVNEVGLSDCSTRPAALEAFIVAGAPPIYIGFGSTCSDIRDLTLSLVRVLVSQGHRVILQHGLAIFRDLVDKLLRDVELSSHVFYIGQDDEAYQGNVALLMQSGMACTGVIDHEWLFPRCRALCHHGGCGVVQCGLRHGRPTLVIAFYGDQLLWGGLVQHHGAGKLLLARRAKESLIVDALQFVLKPETSDAATRLQQLLLREEGAGAVLPRAVDCFHRQLPLQLMRCDVCTHIATQPDFFNQESQSSVRLASFYDVDTQLRLCDVCCYAIFLEKPEPVALQENSDLRLRSSSSESAELRNRNFDSNADLTFRPGRLAVYRALDWGRSRRRWFRSTGTSIENSSEGIVSQPFVGLRSGGLAGTVVGGVSALLSMLAAPVTGIRHFARQGRCCGVPGRRISTDFEFAGDAPLTTGDAPLSSLQDTAIGGLRLCHSSEGGGLSLAPIGSFLGALERLSHHEEMAVYSQVRKAYKEVIARSHCISRMQECGQSGFAEALANESLFRFPFAQGNYRQFSRQLFEVPGNARDRD